MVCSNNISQVNTPEKLFSRLSKQDSKNLLIAFPIAVLAITTFLLFVYLGGPLAKRKGTQIMKGSPKNVLKALGIAKDQSTKHGQFKKGTEPGGFRGIKWGTKISALKKEDELNSASQHDLGWIEHFCFRKSLLGAQGWTSLLFYNKIGRYNAPNQLFGAVYAMPEDVDNFFILKASLVKKFGQSNAGSLDSPKFWEIPCTCSWEGDKTFIILTHDSSREGGIFYMYNKKLHKLVVAKQEEEERQRGLKKQQQFNKWKASIIKKSERGLLQEKEW